MSDAVPSLQAIVPAGGAGTRLWPVSRTSHPKFLLDLTGTGRSLLQQTYDRLVPLVGPGGVNVVTGVRHRDAVAAQLPELGEANLVAEPGPRDSMPAIGLMTALIARRDPDAIVASFAADHLVAGAEEFADAVRQAAAAAAAGYVTTIGIAPTAPSTAYGYIESGAALEGVPGAPDGSVVTRFVEKPDLDSAREYLASGRFRWNAGMFVARADVLLEHLSHQQPRMREGLDVIADAWDGPARAATLDEVWPTLTKIAIDHAIAEPVAAVGGIAIVPGTFGWTDVGDFAAVAEVLSGTEGRTAALGDPALVASVRSSGLVVTDRRTVSVLGVEDVVVVDTPDAVLVTTTTHAQEVKSLVAHWRDAGRDDLL
ncbi:mannose-1-phosphate guanylyltransferase [Mumia sp. zg.B17]|uniref:mannose-1-phosphate guanylyltransferase n=1 Tax=Mumia sp. zg.B17 TaxID=2855446 RepID=UPI001C6F3DB7|nr:mannose-1-phosphate guanylyltransferase [Mumia sp. zg.B17]MBW9204492.1 mannose-1-phosphate guanylyltransferase [Mumia sp. zg.B17]